MYGQLNNTELFLHLLFTFIKISKNFTINYPSDDRGHAVDCAPQF